jgi:hypothetical protein
MKSRRKAVRKLSRVTVLDIYNAELLLRKDLAGSGYQVLVLNATFQGRSLL